MADSSEVEGLPTSSDDLIKERISSRSETLERVVNGHVLSIVGLMMPPLDHVVRDAVERRREGSGKRPKLLVVLETEGGDIEVARRIAETLHHHYKVVEYLVPDYAMSAGTVLVMSGDVIHMDYYSVLGPIDPQYLRDGRYLPGLGYVEKFNEFMEQADKGNLNDAELAYLIERFDPAMLHSIEQERELSVTYLVDWLVKYKFKNWKKTETRGEKVTLEMKQKRAREIAGLLNETKTWHSHNRGIPMSLVRDKLKLVVEDFEQDKDLHGAVRSYYRLLRDYMGKVRHTDAVHQPGHYVGFGG